MILGFCNDSGWRDCDNEYYASQTSMEVTQLMQRRSFIFRPSRMKKIFKSEDRVTLTGYPSPSPACLTFWLEKPESLAERYQKSDYHCFTFEVVDCSRPGPDDGFEEISFDSWYTEQQGRVVSEDSKGIRMVLFRADFQFWHNTDFETSWNYWVWVELFRRKFSLDSSSQHTVHIEIRTVRIGDSTVEVMPNRDDLSLLQDIFANTRRRTQALENLWFRGRDAVAKQEVDAVLDIIRLRVSNERRVEAVRGGTPPTLGYLDDVVRAAIYCLGSLGDPKNKTHVSVLTDLLHHRNRDNDVMKLARLLTSSPGDKHDHDYSLPAASALRRLNSPKVAEHWYKG